MEERGMKRSGEEARGREGKGKVEHKQETNVTEEKR